MSPKTRAIRTLLQALVAVCVAIPSAVALFPISAELATKVTGFAAGFVVLVSALQNAIESRKPDQPAEG